VRVANWVLFFLIAVMGCSKPAPPPATAPSEATTARLGSGQISGVIHFEGAPPPRRAIDTEQDPNCRSVQSEAVEVNDGRLQNVYVYIKDGVPPGKYVPPSEPVVLDQQGCRYVPHVLALMVGQKLEIRNSDPTMHNVHAAARTNEGWNLSQSEHAEPAVTTFSKPETMLPVQCNVHPWMKMYLNISAHPYFAVTGPEGKFQIKGLPPGEYTLAALHEKLGEQTMKVTVRKQPVTADFAFAAAPR